MAKRVQVIMEDDIDGSEASQTVQFALDGAAYEMDLNDAHAQQLRDALGEWVGKARKVTGSRVSKGAGMAGSSRPRIDREQLTKMREWARANGHTVSDRGRVSQSIQNAYHQAH